MNDIDKPVPQIVQDMTDVLLNVAFYAANKRASDLIVRTNESKGVWTITAYTNTLSYDESTKVWTVVETE